MNGDRRPQLTIEHELPGRLRIRLSHALNWPERVRRLVAEHAGVAEVRYTAVSRSLLVRFDANYISTEEILVRIATGFSLERDNGAVRILTRPPATELSDSAFYSGIALIAAFAWRLARGYANPNVALEYATGLATAGAVLNHGWMDYRSQGNFDPGAARGDLPHRRAGARQPIARGGHHLDQQLRPASHSSARSRHRRSSGPHRL